MINFSENKFTTKHAKNFKYFYFCRDELIFLMVSTVFSLIVIAFLFVLDALSVLLTFFVIYALVISCILILSFNRARFMRQGGYYRLCEGVLEKINPVDGSTKKIKVQGKSVVKIKRNEYFSDVVIGGSFIDFIKFFNFRFEHKITVVGVLNDDDFVSVLKEQSIN